MLYLRLPYQVSNKKAMINKMSSLQKAMSKNLKFSISKNILKSFLMKKKQKSDPW